MDTSITPLLHFFVYSALLCRVNNGAKPKSFEVFSVARIKHLNCVADQEDLPSQLYQVALRQQRIAGQPHCGTLDRLHLAAMELLGVWRLLTHDVRQAQTARGLGFESASLF